MTIRRSNETGSGWRPPEGLERTPPREVRLTVRGKALVLFAVAWWIVAGIALVALQLVSARQARTAQAFDADGVDTTGVITALVRRGGEHKHVRVSYHFTAADGRAYDGRANVRPAAASALGIGQTIPVRYRRADPEVNRAFGRRPEVLPPAVAYVSSGGLALSSVLVLLPLRRQRRLVAEGRPAPGHVTRQWRTKHGVAYEYEFVLLSGARRRGRSGPTAKPPAVGDAISVLYDVDTPERNAPYPMALVASARGALRPQLPSAGTK
jgi:hypothetical protein